MSFKAQLYIYHGERLRVWHGGQVVRERPHLAKGRLLDAPSTVEQIMVDLLPATRQGV